MDNGGKTMTDEDMQYLKENLRYDPDTGEFWWTKPKSKRVLSKPAGCHLEGYGCRYVVIGANQKYYLAHRLAFLFMNEDIPFRVDHINGDGHDNRWCNLRPATLSQNMHNMRKNSNNKSGYKGVHWSKASGKWVANIGLNGEKLYLGGYDTPELAYEAYCEAADKYHGEFANYG